MAQRRLLLAAAVAAVGLLTMSVATAAPYASNVTISATTVTFVLNEGGSTLTYSINGGAPQTLDGSTPGAKTFNLTSPTDTFSITATKNDPVGYRIPTGATTPTATNGLSQPTANGGFNPISNDANVLGRYNSPRGVAVNNNPNAGPLFGTTYISNSAAGSVTASGALPARTLGNGIYAIKADGSDAFGYGDTAQNPPGTFDSVTASTSSPFRLSVASDGNVYVADFSDPQGNVWRLNSNLTTGEQVLAGTGGPSTVPPGQNHGSTTAVHAIPGPGGALTLYTVDEDLTANQFGQPGAGTGTGKNNLWRYDIPAPGTLPDNSTPTRINQDPVLISLATSDMHVGAVDGKFYLAQNRAAGNETGVVVLNPDGTTAFDSLTASRALLGNPTAPDILRNIQGMAVSEDQSFMALMLNNSDVAVLPLINGIPDIANRLLIDTGTDINSGRDIAFDAAGNIVYVSSGQGLLRYLSPGGDQFSTLSWDGSSFSFTTTPIPEPSSLALAGLAGVGLLCRRYTKRRVATAEVVD
jgi:hypothetical protein